LTLVFLSFRRKIEKREKKKKRMGGTASEKRSQEATAEVAAAIAESAAESSSGRCKVTLPGGPETGAEVTAALGLTHPCASAFVRRTVRYLSRMGKPLEVEYTSHPGNSVLAYLWLPKEQFTAAERGVLLVYLAGTYDPESYAVPGKSHVSSVSIHPESVFLFGCCHEDPSACEASAGSESDEEDDCDEAYESSESDGSSSSGAEGERLVAEALDDEPAERGKTRARTLRSRGRGRPAAKRARV